MKKKTTPEQRRRYKLHQKLKGFVSFQAKKKTVLTCQKELDQLLPKQLNAVVELRDKFRYNIQLEIR